MFLYICPKSWHWDKYYSYPHNAGLWQESAQFKLDSMFSKIRKARRNRSTTGNWRRKEEFRCEHFGFFFLFSLRAQSCIKDLQSRLYIKIKKPYRAAKKARDCNMKKLCNSLHKVAGAIRKPNVSQRGINKKSWGFVTVRDQILEGRREKNRTKKEGSETLIKLFT